MVVGFTTTYAISTYHHCCCEFESLSELGVKHYVIKIVSDLRQVGPVSSTDITECHNITEMFLKVALNTIKQINKRHLKFGHPFMSLSKIKYINICNGPPICHKV
jgi:hypothetical protein